MGEVIKVLKNKVLSYVVKNLSMFGDDRNGVVVRHIILYIGKI